MNWFRFKVELSSWASKTILAVGTTLVLSSALFKPTSGVTMYPLEMQAVAENEWIFPVALTFGVLVLWVCYWKIFHILRSDKAYGER